MYGALKIIASEQAAILCPFLVGMNFFSLVTVRVFQTWLEK